MATPIVVRESPDNPDYLLIEDIPFHSNLRPLWKADARQLYKALGEALGLYRHTDPCDDTFCPCRAAEADHWRDQGLARP